MLDLQILSWIATYPTLQTLPSRTSQLRTQARQHYGRNRVARESDQDQVELHIRVVKLVEIANLVHSADELTRTA